MSAGWTRPARPGWRRSSPPASSVAERRPPAGACPPIRAWPSRPSTGPGAPAWRIASPKPLDFGRETNGEISLVVDYRVDAKPAGPVTIGMADAAGNHARVTVTREIAGQPVGQWESLAIPLQCFRARGLAMDRVSVPFVLAATGKAGLSVSDVRLDYAGVPMNRCGE